MTPAPRKSLFRLVDPRGRLLIASLIAIAVYLMFGIGFFHHPKTDPPNPLLALPAAVAQP